MLGVDSAKDLIYARLRIDKPGPGFCHFPIGGAFDAEYFSQLTSEAVRTRYKEGRPYRIWVLPEGRRNEALDTAVYALAARHATRIPVIGPLLSSQPAAPSPSDLDEVEAGPEVSVEAGVLPDRHHRDPVYHQAFLESRQPQRSWIRDGGRLPGWWDRDRGR